MTPEVSSPSRCLWLAFNLLGLASVQHPNMCSGFSCSLPGDENSLVCTGFCRSGPLSEACWRGCYSSWTLVICPQQLWPPSQTQAGDTQQSPHAGTCPRVNPGAGERHQAIFADSHLSELCILFCHLCSLAQSCALVVPGLSFLKHSRGSRPFPYGLLSVSGESGMERIQIFAG